MKKLLFTFAAFALCSLARSQAVDLKDFLGPNNSFHDPVFGIALTYPAGWEVVGGGRWGKDNGENTFRFQPIWPSPARPSLYYQRFSATSPRPSDFEAWFRESARKKEESRAQGVKDYRNMPETFSFKTIAGQPSGSYLATFTLGGHQMVEHFVRVAGPTAYVMFFTQGPAEEVAAIRAEIERMAETVRIP